MAVMNSIIAFKFLMHIGESLMHHLWENFPFTAFRRPFCCLCFFFTSLPISHAGVSHLPLYFKINMKIGFLDAKMNIHTPINTHAVCGCGYVLYALASIRFLVPVGICCVDLHTVLYILFFCSSFRPLLCSIRYPLTYSWLAASRPPYVVWLLNDDVFTWQINLPSFLWE